MAALGRYADVDHAPRIGECDVGALVASDAMHGQVVGLVRNGQIGALLGCLRPSERAPRSVAQIDNAALVNPAVEHGVRSLEGVIVMLEDGIDVVPLELRAPVLALVGPDARVVLPVIRVRSK